MTAHALVVGEALVDIVISPAGDHTEIPGGSPANVALTLGRLGREVELVTWLGNDERGHRVGAHIRESHVRIDDASFGATHTSTALASIDETGAATYQFDLAWQVPTVCVDPSVIVTHSGSIAATLEPGGSSVVRVLSQAREFSTITYDPNARPTIMGDPKNALARVEEIVAISDVVKVSDEDIEWLTGGSRIEATARRWLSMGAGLIVVTLGSRGAWAVCAQGTVKVPAPVCDVVDTVGAGDSFMGGLIDALWRENLLGADRRVELAGVDIDALTRVLEHSTAISAITVSRAGANPPWAAELV
ncbi:MAG: carbohydrate kinase [Actinomycetaceae bacterium]|nr:carbohydrate kinase [Actinomycetaceae bacterium]